MAELRGELPFHRDRLDQSPLSPALQATHHLLWFNFAHLFSMSLLPLSTAWMAVSELAPQPVAFYAAVFFLVNATYVLLIWELVDRNPGKEISPSVRRIMLVRPVRSRSGRGAEISAARTRNLYRLPDRLSETRAAGREQASISLGAGVMGPRAATIPGTVQRRRRLPAKSWLPATSWLPAKTWPPGS
jgi:hypothetical protein